MGWRSGARQTDLIEVQEQGGSVPGLCYRAPSPLCNTAVGSTGWISANTWHATLAYVTGAHNIKFGYLGLFDYDNQQSNYTNPTALNYRFNNGVPNQFTEFSGLFASQWRTRFDAFFAQDQWSGNQSQYWDGVDVNVAMRPARGLTFQGGTSTGQTVQDFCAVAAKVPESLVAPQTVTIGVSIPGATAFGVTQAGAMPMEYCHLASGFLTQFRGLGSYQVPRVDVEISATFQTKPGQQLAANYPVPAAVVTQALGRAPAGGVANVTVNLVTPGSLYGDRVNELDLRLSKVLKFGHTRTKISMDLYNALNSPAVLTYNQTYNPATTTWLTPTSVLAARVIKFGASFDF